MERKKKEKSKPKTLTENPKLRYASAASEPNSLSTVAN
jgi:hypothetical protein